MCVGVDVVVGVGVVLMPPRPSFCCVIALIAAAPMRATNTSASIPLHVNEM